MAALIPYRIGVRMMSADWWAGEPLLRMGLIDDAGTYAYDVEDLVVADLDPEANELAVDGYERQTVTAGAPIWDAPKFRLPMSAANFGFLGDGVPEDPTVQGAFLYWDPTEGEDDDSTSELIGWLPVNEQLDSTLVEVVPHVSGLVIVEWGST